MKPRKFTVVVSPKGQKESRHEITAKNIEEARSKANSLGAKRGTTRTHVIIH